MITNPLELQDGYGLAGGIENPFFRLCADYPLPTPVTPKLYERIRRQAGLVQPHRAFLLGQFAEYFTQEARAALVQQAVSHSALSIDGVIDNGSINISIWMQKRDLDSTPMQVLQNTFEGDLGIIVAQRIEEVTSVPDELQTASRMFGMRTSTIGRILYSNMPHPFAPFYPLPPHVMHFYGGETPSRELLGIMEEVIRAGSDLSLSRLTELMARFRQAQPRE